MPAYATAERAAQLYGEDYLVVGCDRDNDGIRDPGVFESWLEVATNLINGYLVGCNPLPLPRTPPQLEVYCIDIAVYQSRPTADVLTEEVEKRYNAAIRYLEHVQKNRVRLVPDDEAPVQVQNIPAQAEAFAISECTGERTFTRDRMRGL